MSETTTQPGEEDRPVTLGSKQELRRRPRVADRLSHAWVIALVAITVVTSACGPDLTSRSVQTSNNPLTAELLFLPPASTSAGPSLHEVLAQRRSVREYSQQTLSLDDIGQLLWAAQGVTSPAGARTSPSAGGTYPLELYIVVGIADWTPGAGVYRYRPNEHALEPRSLGVDLRNDLAVAAFGQQWVLKAPVSLVLTAVYDRTTAVYGERGRTYVALEAGHAAQNALLEATALGLGAVPVGSFDDTSLAQLLGLPADEVPLYVIPVGHPLRTGT